MLQGYVHDFTLDYIVKTENDIELIFQNSLFFHFDYNEVITVNNTNRLARQPLIAKGIFIKSMLFNKVKERSTTFLLKFEAGACNPYRDHPGWEEVYV